MRLPSKIPTHSSLKKPPGLVAWLSSLRAAGQLPRGFGAPQGGTDSIICWHIGQEDEKPGWIWSSSLASCKMLPGVKQPEKVPVFAYNKLTTN